MLHYFGFSGLITIAAVLLALLTLGPAAAVTTLVLIAIEIAFSFDNAIINAKVLERLSGLWQQMFLTIGMIIAILGMRLVFPVLVVMITAHLPWSQVISEALHQPAVYGSHLRAAHATIAAFGGSFLLTLALYFLFDDTREVRWLERLERPLQRIGGSIWLPPLVAAMIVGLVALFAGNHASVLRAGLVGVLSYTAIKLFIDALGHLAPAGNKQYTGWVAALAFVYLQVLDASFSFDGVLGAFAITDKVLLIALGLGVGAIWVRSLTVFMVRRGTLKAYIYLEHGAHYAIVVLAAALLSSIFFNLPDAVTGIVGLGIIGASFVASHQAKQALNNS
ncbi:MAG TPA: DUF475 domain-containing protein [Candidatus Dormibacteraeota bacterium]|nr:DUF475 domain-containing protein [Candidatus Dormibacteraeota bacterium]